MFENVLKQQQKLWLCDDHLEQFKDEDFRRQLLDRTLESLGALHKAGFRLSPQDLLNSPEQLALTAHQETCDRCRAVRDWVIDQQLTKRVVDKAGIDRVGRYVTEHCCEIGLRLNYEVGVAMQGGHP